MRWERAAALKGQLKLADMRPSAQHWETQELAKFPHFTLAVQKRKVVIAGHEVPWRPR